MHVNRIVGFSVTAALLAALCFACSAPADDALTTLLDTERDFSTASSAYGMKAAFLRFLHDDSILFRPHPVNGKRYTSGRPDSGVQLSWEPTRAAVAHSGDLGWTTGPYRVAPEEDGDPALLGYFVSIWKRQPNGRWKVAVDLGTENPPDDSCAEEPDLTAPQGATAPGRSDADPATARAALFDLERLMSQTSVAKGIAIAYRGALEEDVRLYRDGRCPATERDPAKLLLAETPGVMSWEPIDGSVAETGDLAYTYGSYKLASPLDREVILANGYYVRLWRTRPEGDWGLILEVTSPVPAEEAADDEVTAD
jgi:ketosteroid isomerase-like protein